MGIWDALTGRSRGQPAEPRRAVHGAERGHHAGDRGRPDARPAPARSASAPPRARRSADPGRHRRAARRRRARRPRSRSVTDEYGFTWLWSPSEPGDVSGAVHRPARRQHDAGGAGLRLGPAVLGRPVRRRAGRRVGLVYLYKQGTFYPFAPAGREQDRRDNLLELQVRDHSRASCRWSPTCTAGWPCGEPRASDGRPVATLGCMGLTVGVTSGTGFECWCTWSPSPTRTGVRC